ncbi:Uncharacterized mitochondrial protein AtMg00310 [Linum grandiflorum]
MSQPTSLVARLYRAKYYPTGDFLSAGLGHHPSFVWRSLWKSQPILQRRIRWKIGNGHRINVWSSPWLKDDNNPYIKTPQQDMLSQLCVADLILPFTRAWNMPLIQSLFSSRDISQIQALPIDITSGDDKLIWHYGKTGQYSVK